MARQWIAPVFARPGVDMPLDLGSLLDLLWFELSTRGWAGPAQHHAFVNRRAYGKIVNLPARLG